MEAITKQHFLHHGKANAADPDEKDNCHLCQIRSFETHSTLPITIINTTRDGATLPPDFRFIDKSIIAPDVPVLEDSFRAGCSCEDNEECMYDTCHCLDELAPDSDEESDEFGEPRRRKRFAYHSQGVKAGLLRSNYLETGEQIYECHAGCSCSPDCPNRVVERGRTVPLQIFRTEDRGWGVRCPLPIRKGQFVDRYLGEIITGEEADRRREAAEMAAHKDVYLFALDKFSDKDSLNPMLAGSPLEVDGEYISGPSRFINHSCDPNLRSFARVGDHADKHMHDLGLFALRDIPQYEELTFDYVSKSGDLEEDAHDPSKRQDMTICLCGTEKCRGFLW